MDKHLKKPEVDEVNDPKVFEELFETRAEFNKETVFLLSKDDAFMKRIEAIRSETNSEIVSAEILSILFEYGLPSYFDKWLQELISNKELLPEVQVGTYDFLMGLVSHPSEIVRVPLTTKEKSLVSDFFKSLYGEMAPEIWRKYEKLLAQSKNTRRRSRNHKLAQVISEKRKEVVAFKVRANDSDLKRKKKTYLDATAELYPDEDGLNDSKTAQKLRKQVERSKKRMKGLGDVKNNVTNLLRSSLK